MRKHGFFHFDALIEAEQPQRFGVVGIFIFKPVRRRKMPLRVKVNEQYFLPAAGEPVCQCHCGRRFGDAALLIY